MSVSLSRCAQVNEISIPLETHSPAGSHLQAALGTPTRPPHRPHEAEPPRQGGDGPPLDGAGRPCPCGPGVLWGGAHGTIFTVLFLKRTSYRSVRGWPLALRSAARSLEDSVKWAHPCEGLSWAGGRVCAARGLDAAGLLGA